MLRGVYPAPFAALRAVRSGRGERAQYDKLPTWAMTYDALLIQSPIPLHYSQSVLWQAKNREGHETS